MQNIFQGFRHQVLCICVCTSRNPLKPHFSFYISRSLSLRAFFLFHFQGFQHQVLCICVSTTRNPFKPPLSFSMSCSLSLFLSIFLALSLCARSLAPSSKDSDTEVRHTWTDRYRARESKKSRERAGEISRDREKERESESESERRKRERETERERDRVRSFSRHHVLRMYKETDRE